jgi:hypothetical protein
MDNLSPEAKALYDLLKADTTEEYETRFIAYKKELLDAVKVYVTDTKSQLKEMSSTVEGVRTSMGSDLQAAKDSLGAELDSIKTSLSAEIADLAATVDRALRHGSGAVAGGSSFPLSKEANEDPSAQVGTAGNTITGERSVRCTCLPRSEVRTSARILLLRTKILVSLYMVLMHLGPPRVPTCHNLTEQILNYGKGVARKIFREA